MGKTYEIDSSRREFLKDLLVVGAVTAAARSADRAVAGILPANRLPKIKLGTLEVSRLILGSNPFFGFAHGNPQAGPDEMKQWYTSERIMAVMDEAAEHGITAVWTPCYEHWIRLWNKYQDRGGKLKIWIAQPDRLPMKKEIAAAVKNGSKAVCVQGCRVDDEVKKGRFDVLRDWVEYIKSFGLPAGIATHRPDTHLMAEEKGLPTDFYHQCLYQPENYSEKCRDMAMTTIKKLDKPVVGYKVLAAGRIPPKVAFAHAFKHLRRKDGICVGVFPKDNPDEIVEDAALTKKLTRSNLA